jgi:pSer/pThr/pTyr-binding forkhead associated (FHA) protein
LPYEISVISIGRALAILQSEYNEIERRFSGDVSGLSIKLEITIMSGVEDGLQLSYAPENGDGQTDADGKWLISVGRREDSDICLRNDTFVSRLHAYVYWDSDHWWLQDCDSTNGTFLEHSDSDARVKGTIPISAGVLFRIGHTWMRIEANE